MCQGRLRVHVHVCVHILVRSTCSEGIFQQGCSFLGSIIFMESANELSVDCFARHSRGSILFTKDLPRAATYAVVVVVVGSWAYRLEGTLFSSRCSSGGWAARGGREAGFEPLSWNGRAGEWCLVNVVLPWAAATRFPIRARSGVHILFF